MKDIEIWASVNFDNLLYNSIPAIFAFWPDGIIENKDKQLLQLKDLINNPSKEVYVFKDLDSYKQTTEDNVIKVFAYQENGVLVLAVHNPKHEITKKIIRNVRQTIQRQTKHEQFKAYHHPKEFDPKFVFDNFITDSRKRLAFELPEETITIKTNSERYILFRDKGLTCVSCGLMAAYAKVTMTDPGVGHFSFFGKNNNNEEILFTKDHIIPKCAGGSDTQNNYQVMCSVCNCKKGNNI